ncbi:MAG: glycosyltransferase [Pseudobdellovibrio sp.]
MILQVCVSIGAYLSERRQKKGQLRSLWGITPIITLNELAKSERLLGNQSESVVYDTYYITHNFDRNLKLISALGRRLFKEHFYRLVLGWSLLRYDVFHYFQDRGILSPVNRQVPIEELEALKKSGKRLYFYTYGADCRTREITLGLGKFNCCMNCPDIGKHCICSDKFQSEKILSYQKYANALVSMGDMISYVPGNYKMDYWPLDMSRSDFKSNDKKEVSDNLVIAHAPNHSFFKGSEYLKKCIEELNHEGLKIRLLVTSGKPNSEVLKMFDQCDLVADQFIIGAYGYTTLEAMAKGKASLCFIRNQNVVHEATRAPIINCNPDNLKEVLKWLYFNKEKLQDLSRYSRSYVAKFHSQEAVAVRLGELYLTTGHFNELINTRLNKAIIEINEKLSNIESPVLPRSSFPPSTFLGDQIV